MQNRSSTLVDLEKKFWQSGSVALGERGWTRDICQSGFS